MTRIVLNQEQDAWDAGFAAGKAEAHAENNNHAPFRCPYPVSARQAETSERPNRPVAEH
jgi:hypothetical protein